MGSRRRQDGELQQEPRLGGIERDVEDGVHPLGQHGGDARTGHQHLDQLVDLACLLGRDGAQNVRSYEVEAFKGLGQSPVVLQEAADAALAARPPVQP